MANQRDTCVMIMIISIIVNLMDRTSTTSNEPICGVPAISPRVAGRIVGGEKARPHSWPWQVSLQTNTGHRFCGGSIIDRMWVISAAHCQPEKEWGQIYVMAGQHSSDDPTRPFQQRIAVAKLLIHRSFRPMNYDIMLVKLKEPLQYYPEVSPVCLPETDDTIQTGTKCYLTGWGRLDYGGRKPKKLYQVALPILDQEKCAKWYLDPKNWYDDMGKAFPVTRNMICAGYPEGGASGCHGDSGGPFVCKKGGAWILSGIVSWGGPCGQRHTPTVMTNVNRFTGWIKKTLRQN